MRRSSGDDPSSSRNPPNTTISTPPRRRRGRPRRTTPTPSSSSHNTDSDALVPVAHASAPPDPVLDLDPVPVRYPYAALPVPLLPGDKTETIPPPFPWATDRRAKVHNLSYLLENDIVTIAGQFYCKNCKRIFNKNIDLKEAIKELSSFIQHQKEFMDDMDDKAPAYWLRPEIQCERCEKNACIEPLNIKDTRKRDINWLFLLLTELLGCCTFAQLKYYIKHNNITNLPRLSKPRVLYATYMHLYKQVVPDESILRSI